MSTAIGVSSAVMINRMALTTAQPQGNALVEVARLRLELERAQAEEQAKSIAVDPLARTVANGAEVDLLI